jgi:hypothetical protein
MSNLIIPFFANMGVQTTPPFSNTYSLDFDGVDDYVDCGNSAALKPNIITVSCWIKGSTQTAFTRIISQDGPTGGADAYGFYVTTALNKVVFAIKTDVTGTVTSATSGVVLDNSWHHLVGTYDGSEVILYVDGVAVGSPSAGTSILSYGIGGLTIGCFSEPTSLPSYLFNGNIDEVSIFNSVIPIGDLWDGSGQPTDLSLLATPPIAWYRMGDNGTYKSPQWLIPNNENKDKVSNYSFEFDGMDDYVDVGTSLNLGTDSTISFWVKRGRVNTDEMFLGENTYLFDYFIFVTSSNTIYIRINTVFLEFTGTSVTSVMNDTTNWINIVAVRSGDSIELFLNGNSVGTQSGYGALIDTRFDTIAAKPSGGFPFMGNIDELAAWDNNTINPLDIYNGGTPTTLPSGAVAHYKMGEEATFSGGVWTVPDAIGSNNGTSNAMTIEDRVSEAPGSENNALSYNMDLVDRVTDTP